MKNSFIKVGSVVPNIKVADIKWNTNEILNCIEQNQDCSLLVFPELCISGYTCGDLFHHELLLNECESALSTIAKESQKYLGLTIVVSLPIRFENDLYNCGVFVSEGRIAGIIPKIHIPNYNEFYEARWFTSGKGVIGKEIEICNQPVPFGVDVLAEDKNSGAVIGMDICEDLWVADRPSTHACLAGANIIVNPSASDEVIGKQDYRRDLVKSQSASCYCAYIYASSGTGESSTDLVFSGHSLIAENGKLLKDSIFPDESHTETALIDLETLKFNRMHQNTYVSNDTSYRHVDVAVSTYGGDTISVEDLSRMLQDENQIPSRMPFVPSDDQELAKRCQRILQIQANGLATRVKATGIYNLVIGVSGGLDSTLALIVCHEARKLVPSIRILGYTMPVKGNTTSQTYENAIALMKALDAEIHEVEIGESVAAHLQAIGHSSTYQGEGDITYENAQARMRTYILMDASNLHQGLVVGTGDLSELALGWCTYNGDHMSMYAVNSSVPKTLVQYICRAYAHICGDDELKETLLDIVDTPISPELTPNQDGQIAQKTEEKIGKYDLNDFFLFYTLRYGFAPDKILGLAMSAYSEILKEDIKNAEQRFYQRFFHQQFKRSCLPDGPKVGSVTLSPRGDWRMPSDASVNLWLENLKNA